MFAPRGLGWCVRSDARCRGGVGVRWAGGPPFLLLLVSVPGKQGREQVRRRSAPADGRV
jgi:hypothetical protein